MARIPSGLAAPPMHIVVLLKQVYDPGTPPDRLAVGADGRSIIVEAGLPPVMNGYDANALEEAIRMKERLGARVTALSLGPEQAAAVVRRALALGADAGVLVEAPSGLAEAAETTAARIVAAMRRLAAPDLVLCGRSASDTDAGQVPALIAAAFDAPLVLPVRAVVATEETHIVVERLSDRGAQRLRVALPCVIGVSSEANTPRAPGLKGVMTAKKAAITVWTAADLAADVAPAVRLRHLAVRQTPAAETEFIPGGPAEAGAGLADRLLAAGLVP